MLVTKTVRLVTNNSSSSPIHLVANIRHQHRCSKKINNKIYRYENNDTQMPWYSWIYNNTWTYGTRMPFSYFQQWLFLGLNKLTFTHGYFNAFYWILHVFHRQICLRFPEMSPWQCDNRETFSKLRFFISNQLYLNHFWKNTEECGLLLNIWIVNM